MFQNALNSACGVVYSRKNLLKLGVKKILTLTILIPCLNESETLLTCIRKAQGSLQTLNISGEVLVADNGSTDGSQDIAIMAGARVVNVPERGYGAALISGINNSDSKYIVMGDADDSYALDDLGHFVNKLEDGFDLVMGNRFLGGISPGAMPWLHKYLGNPVLSWLGRVLFKVPIGDFHCGLRAFRTDSIRGLKLRSIGMEFASEMVVKAQLNGLRISEVPTTLKPDGRSRAPHLRTWRDGWRHLIFLLVASPRFLFLYPGILFLFLGFSGLSLTVSGTNDFFLFFLGSNTFLLSIGLILVGVQIILMAMLARIFSSKVGTLPVTKHVSRFQARFSLERGIVLGLFLVLISLAGVFLMIFDWNGTGFETFSTSTTLRISGGVVLALLSGVQILFASFFASMIQAG
jgi:glycosyltransferase involved in cell wall biosynthesis